MGAADGRHDFRIYVVGRVRKAGELREGTSRYEGKPWAELTPAEHQRLPGDYEAQTGQGPITLHSEEHLASSDRGVALVRRVLKEQIDIVKSGGNPMGVSLAADQATVKTEAGNFLAEAQPENNAAASGNQER